MKNQVFSYIESRQDIDQSAVERLIEVINKNTDGEFMNYLERREQQAQQHGALLKAEETARTMLVEGLDEKLVIKCTGLDLNTVLKLKKNIKK
ncbi:hypothetical protein [Facilibium subflavum]|uniref:hypothetical protein n=1 Tax=Facilibium subflavum TaxID=2219058 RepID=UPI000E647683|nr:hypothetical protein [Facilibium subflavum]